MNAVHSGWGKPLGRQKPFRASGAATCLADHAEGCAKVDNCAKKALYEQSTVSGGLNPWRKRACGWSPQPFTNSYTQGASQRRAAEAGAPHRDRGRAAHGSGQRQPVWPPGRDHDPRRLPARPTGFRAGRPPTWDQVDFGTATLHVRRVKKGTPRPVQFSATNCGRCGGMVRAGPQVALRVHLGATQHNALA